MEHRWHDRKTTNLDVIIKSVDQVSTCKCHDISLMGMSVQIKPPHSFSKGNSVNLKISLEKTLEPIYIKGIIVNTSEKGMGLMFNHNNLRQIDLLETYMDSL